jgi:cell division protein FtsZ
LENDETVIDEVEEEEANDSSAEFNTDETPQATLNFELDVEAPTLNFSLEEESSEESPLDFPIQSESPQPQKEVISEVVEEDNVDENEVVVHTLEMEEEAEEVIKELKDEVEKDEFTQINHGISAEQMALRSRQRMDRLREITMKLRTPSGLTDLESEPAYKRREVELDDVAHSSESEASNYVLGEDDDKNIGIKPNNFLHDNVD